MSQRRDASSVPARRFDRGTPGRSWGSRRAAMCGIQWIAITLLWACASAPESVLIALPSVPRSAPAVPTAPGAAVQPVLIVRRLEVPEYMQSRRIRYWADPETIAQWPDAYWAERIEVDMTRAFVAALRGRLPRWTICVAACGDSTGAITLAVDLLRLDFVRRQRVILTTAQIGVSNAAADKPSPTRLEPLLDLSTPVLTDSAQGEAQALSVMLDQLAEVAAKDAVQNAAALAARAPVSVDGAVKPHGSPDTR